MGSADSETARRFFEQHFRVELLAGEGVLTGYFAPVYSARRHRDAVYSAPVRPLPQPGATLSFIAPDSRMSDQARHQAEEIAAVTGSAPSLDAAYAAALPASSPPTGGSSDPVADLLGRDDAPHASTDMSSSPPERTQLVRFQEADRSVIEQAPADDALAWMKPEDLFFMQIQGSGLLVFENGQRLRAAYAGDNGKAFVPIARHMIRDGQLQQNGASGDAIRGWLSGHSGDQAKQVMNKNPRYVFFRLKTDDGREPTGAAGVPLPPGRAIALDNSRHAYGELYWIDAQAPTLSGAAVRYRRLAMALDTGGAIRGDVRADLYLGTGQDAGREAGRVKHVLHMARLVPFDPDNAEATLAASNSPGRR
jgi:membrane-bound lytic murein transglycosylase A